MIEHRTKQLEIVADWRDSLEIQINRALLLRDLGLLDGETVDALEWRVYRFREACQALSDEIGGRHD